MSNADTPMINLPLSDPACIRAGKNCTAFAIARNASREAIPPAGNYKYGHWATWYYITLIGLLFVGYIFLQLEERQFIRSLPLRRLKASYRYVIYRRLPPSFWRRYLDLPASYGVWILLLLTIAYLTAVAFGPRPYYREQLGYASPPLAVRAAMMAVACIPILVALAGKANIVTLFTGISHERLNIFHRWVAWMSFVLALVHASSFIYAAYSDRGWGGLEREQHEFIKDGITSASQASGLPTILVLFLLCLLSIPYLRERFHETFWLSHAVLAITYLALVFWHSNAGAPCDSWAYLWATVAVWLASWLTRALFKTQQLRPWNKMFVGYPTVFSALPGRLTRMDISVPSSFEWRTGQHVFVRLPHLQPLNSHPFTIASCSSSKDSGNREVLLLARAHHGLTLELNEFAKLQPTKAEDPGSMPRVWLDGPYGGLAFTPKRSYNRMILFAAGTGISAMLPWILDAANAATDDSDSRLKTVALIWSIADTDPLTWVREEMEFISKRMEEPKDLEIIVQIHVTGQQSPENPLKSPDVSSQPVQVAEDDDVTSNETEKKSASSNVADSTVPPCSRIVQGRPNMRHLIEEFAPAGSRTLVLGCGPEGFRTDLANTVARAQLRALRTPGTEIALHLESYGW